MGWAGLGPGRNRVRSDKNFAPVPSPWAWAGPVFDPGLDRAWARTELGVTFQLEKIKLDY